jgi:transitional endoplasmic reticulum ATPase
VTDERKNLRSVISAAFDEVFNKQKENPVMATAQPTTARRRALATKQDELSRQALQQLAILGGAMTQEDDVTYEGRKFIFPEQYSADPMGLHQYVTRYVESQTEMITVTRTYSFHPHDGAYATMMCLKQFFGYAQSKAKQGMFGPEPPQEVDIAIGYVDGKLQRVTVPFNSNMVLPGLKKATLSIGASMNRELGPVLQLSSTCRRVDKSIVEGFYNAVQNFLENHSIYRGQAIDGAMGFIDTEKIDPNQFVYTTRATAQLETHILSPLAHADVLKAEGLALKRVVLLEGPYGTGKSGMGRIAAKIAVQHGVTAIVARPGIDDPFELMKRGRMYEPSMIFIEDVDTFASSVDPAYVTKMLDAFDGFTTKESRMLLVLTTNHADRIHKGMIRPGRLDAMIEIGAMDRDGVETLTKLVVGDRLDDNVDFDAVFAATEGYMPAYVREGIERAIRYTIARTGRAGAIGTDDLVNSCQDLRPQFELQQRALDHHEPLPPLDQMFRQLIEEHATPSASAIEEAVDEKIMSRLNGAAFADMDGRPKFRLIPND